LVRHHGPAQPDGGALRRRLLGILLPAALIAGALSACTGEQEQQLTPGLAERGTTFTTAKPTRQDLTSRLSLTGTVTLNPTFGIAAPVRGQIRYFSYVAPPRSTPTKPTQVANIWKDGKATPIRVPAGAVFSGRLVDDRSTVEVGMPIVSAKYVGYGIVAEIDSALAYQISDNLESVQAQITNGPGPFPCEVLGTIAALPAGVIPEPPPPPQPEPDPNATAPPVAPQPEQRPQLEPSEATGMRVVCTPPDDVKLINGASATVEVVTATAKDVLVLPVEAVAGSHGKGKVDVLLPDGSRQTVDVELGLSDGAVIEIKSGLTGDETVAVPGPNLPPGPAGEGDPKGPPVRFG